MHPEEQAITDPCAIEEAVDRGTRDLRTATLQGHLGVLAPRVGGPLDDVLRAFATGHTFGRLGAYWLLMGVVPLVRPHFSAVEDSPLGGVEWAAETFTGIRVALRRARRIPHEIDAGLDACCDRTIRLYFDRHIVRASDDLLATLFDVLASAYATGVALAREADAAPPTEEMGAVLEAVASLDGLDQSLLHESYGFRLTHRQIAAARGWEEPMVMLRLATALEEVWRGTRVVQAADRACTEGIAIELPSSPARWPGIQ